MAARTLHERRTFAGKAGASVKCRVKHYRSTKDPNTEYTQSYYMHITSFNFATNSDSQAAIWPNRAKNFCKVRLLTSAYSKENCHIATILVSCHRLCSESKLSKLPLKLDDSFAQALVEDRASKFPLHRVPEIKTVIQSDSKF